MSSQPNVSIESYYKLALQSKQKRKRAKRQQKVVDCFPITLDKVDYKSSSFHLQLLRILVFKYQNLFLDPKFLLRAEARYLKFLFYLNNLFLSNKLDLIEKGLFVPPLDVVMCWHIHMSQTSNYIEDISRLFNESICSVSIPIQEIVCVLLESDEHFFHEPSALEWESFTGEQYLLMEDLTPFSFSCPCCLEVLTVPLEEYTQLKTNPNYTGITCSCGKILTKSYLTSLRLISDIFQAQNDDFYLAGTLIDPKTCKFEHTRASNFVNLVFKNKNFQLLYSCPDSVNPWKIISQVLKSVDCNLGERVQKSYKNNLSPLSVDLLQLVKSWSTYACLLVDWFTPAFSNSDLGKLGSSFLPPNFKIKRSFAFDDPPEPPTYPPPKNFTSPPLKPFLQPMDFFNSDVVFVDKNIVFPKLDKRIYSNVIFLATVRYHKFLLLQKDSKTTLSPAIDVFLCRWTHSLSPLKFVEHSNVNFKRLVPISFPERGKLDTLLSQTAKQWTRRYREPYCPGYAPELTIYEKIYSVFLLLYHTLPFN